MTYRWWHNNEDCQWELVRDRPPANLGDAEELRFTLGIDMGFPEVLCTVRDEFVAGAELGFDGLRKLIDQAHPEWPKFPDEKARKELRR